MTAQRPANAPGVDARRRGAVRTAWVFAAIAAAIYVAFILSGVLGR